ncbi:MAG: hypothetical protein SFX18_14685 [Pirellulales bacterium]|nr:hypothetical protein [Pirellulales bacterium]
MKKFFALMVMAAMTVSMIGCGETKKADPKPADTPAAGTTDKPAETPKM